MRNQELGSRLERGQADGRQMVPALCRALRRRSLRLPPPGRPLSVSDEQVAILLRRIIKQKLPVGTRWTVRMAAEANKLSKSRMHRVFQLIALQPHRSKSLKLSTDSPYPFFVEESRAVVGLHLKTPYHEMVLSA